MNNEQDQEYIYDSTDVVGLPIDMPVLDGVGDEKIILYEGDITIIL